MIGIVNFLCLSAIFVQTATGQCVTMTNGLDNSAYFANGLAKDVVAGVSNGGRFAVTSASPIPTSGVMVQSDKLLLDGSLSVTGQLPFLGIVALGGTLPADGIATVQYDCGDGKVGITKEETDLAVKMGVGVNSHVCNGGQWANPWIYRRV